MDPVQVNVEPSPDEGQSFPHDRLASVSGLRSQFETKIQTHLTQQQSLLVRRSSTRNSDDDGDSSDGSAPPSRKTSVASVRGSVTPEEAEARRKELASLFAIAENQIEETLAGKSGSVDTAALDMPAPRKSEARTQPLPVAQTSGTRPLSGESFESIRKKREQVYTDAEMEIMKALEDIDKIEQTAPRPRPSVHAAPVAEPPKHATVAPPTPTEGVKVAPAVAKESATTVSAVKGEVKDAPAAPAQSASATTRAPRKSDAAKPDPLVIAVQIAPSVGETAPETPTALPQAPPPTPAVISAPVPSVARTPAASASVPAVSAMDACDADASLGVSEWLVRRGMSVVEGGDVRASHFVCTDGSGEEYVARMLAVPEERDFDEALAAARDVFARLRSHPHGNVEAPVALHPESSSRRIAVLCERSGVSSLREWFAREGRTSSTTPQLRSILRDVLRAIAHLHDLGIVHGHVSLDAIVVSGAPPTARLCSLTYGVSIPHCLTPNDDMFAFGCTIFEAVVGRPAALAPGSTRLALPSDADTSLRLLVRAFTCRQPQKRATALTALLEHFPLGDNAAEDLFKRTRRQTVSGRRQSGSTAADHDRIEAFYDLIATRRSAAPHSLLAIDIPCASTCTDTALRAIEALDESDVFRPLRFVMPTASPDEAPAVLAEGFYRIFFHTLVAQHGEILEWAAPVAGQSRCVLPARNLSRRTHGMLESIGRIIVRCIVDGCRVPLPFSSSILKFLVGRPPSPRDLEAFSAEAAGALDQDARHMHAAAAVAIESQAIHPESWTEAKATLFDTRKNELEAIRAGMRSSEAHQRLRRMSCFEIAWLCCGQIDTVAEVARWARQALVYEGYGEGSHVASHMDAFVANASLSELRRLLYLTTCQCGTAGLSVGADGVASYGVRKDVVRVRPPNASEKRQSLSASQSQVLFYVGEIVVPEFESGAKLAQEVRSALEIADRC